MTCLFRLPMMLSMLLVGVAASSASAQPPQTDPEEALDDGALAPVAEDPREQQAREHFEQGAALYDAARYAEALQQFEQAYELSQRAELFYNFSLCHQRMDDYGDAAHYLERYLLEVIEIQNRADLELRLHRLRESSSRVEEPLPPPPAPKRNLMPALISFAVAGAGLITTAIAGPMALSSRSDLEESGCGVTVACDASTLRRRAIVSDIGLGLTVAGAAVGVLLLFVGPGKSVDQSDERALRITPSVNAHSVQLAAGGAF